MRKLKKIIKLFPGMHSAWRGLYRITVYLRNLLLFRIIYRRRKAFIPIDSILIGQQSGYPLKKWIPATGEYGRVSLPINNSPYAVFLRDILADETRLGDRDFLREHPYFRMAEISVRQTGHFMGATCEEEIFRVMREFFEFHRAVGGANPTPPDRLSPRGHSLPETPVILHKIKYSENYEVVDGHHRIAAAAAAGRTRVRAVVTGEETSYLQDLVLAGRQTHGDRELYQPLPQPEVASWPLVRRCRDRFQMMDGCLLRENIYRYGLTLLDCSCSYGWFLQEFKRRGVRVLGIDRDPVPVAIGRAAYQLSPGEIVEADLVSFLQGAPGTFDIVLFLSLLHHFAIGQEKGDVAEILQRLDRITGRVLFLDTGQNHEEWWRESLPEWDDGFISRTIRLHTSFRKVRKLGEDRDDTGPYKNQYRRSLFACLR